MTKIEELRNYILNATCSGDLPDTALATFDDMVEAVELLNDLGHYDFDMVIKPHKGTYERELYDRLVVLTERLK